MAIACGTVGTATVPIEPDRIQAVTFDLDYTLWDLSGVIEAAEQTSFEFLQEYYPDAAARYDVQALRDKRFALAGQRPDIAHNVTALRLETFRAVARECGYDETMAKRAFDCFIDARHAVTMFDDTETVLTALAERFVLGAITNGNADIARLGLAGYFQFQVSPMDVGAAKPDRVIFEAACHRAGVEPGAVVHVGDEPEADVMGAARHGMHAVWANRFQRPWPADIPAVAHVEIARLNELLHLLA